MNYKIIKFEDIEYPSNLRYIYDPPRVLYCLGNISLLNNICIAIIGCRESSSYGNKVAKYFSNRLSQAGITVVSGLAHGIDGVAHKYSLNNIGRTIAVLGSGLDIVYPRENESLYNDILKNGGLIISEFPLGTKPLKENFPKRNRIVSGLSHGVLVVEAKRKSGTSITVDFALEQGRDVYVVPGNIDSENSEGTNELIKQGAYLVTNPNEILCKLKW